MPATYSSTTYIKIRDTIMGYQIHADLRIIQKGLYISLSSWWSLHALCVSPLQISHTHTFLLGACFQPPSSPFLFTSCPHCSHSLVSLPRVSLPNHLAKCLFVNPSDYDYGSHFPALDWRRATVAPGMGLQELKVAWTNGPCTVRPESAWGSAIAFHLGTPYMIGFVFSPFLLQAAR